MVGILWYVFFYIIIQTDSWINWSYSSISGGGDGKVADGGMLFDLVFGEHS